MERARRIAEENSISIWQPICHECFLTKHFAERRVGTRLLSIGCAAPGWRSGSEKHRPSRAGARHLPAGPGGLPKPTFRGQLHRDQQTFLASRPSLTLDRQTEVGPTVMRGQLLHVRSRPHSPMLMPPSSAAPGSRSGSPNGFRIRFRAPPPARRRSPRSRRGRATRMQARSRRGRTGAKAPGA